MENIYIPGYGTFTLNFNVDEHIYDYQGEPLHIEEEENDDCVIISEPGPHIQWKEIMTKDELRKTFGQPGKSNPMYGRCRKGEKHKGGKNISAGLKEMYNTKRGEEIKEQSRKRLSENNPAKNKNIMEKSKELWRKAGRNTGSKNGMYGKKGAMTGKKLYTNGKVTKAFFEGKQPDGWKKGRHTKKSS